MATVYMNQCLAQVAKTEMHSKMLFLQRVLNKFNDYFVTLKCSMAHHKACVKHVAILAALKKF